MYGGTGTLRRVVGGQVGGQGLDQTMWKVVVNPDVANNAFALECVVTVGVEASSTFTVWEGSWITKWEV